MKYRLSNNQRKGLLVRGEQLQIALPLPYDWPDEATPQQLRQFVADHLPEITNEQLIAVREQDLCIHPAVGVFRNSNPHLPRIVEDHSEWHMVVLVAVATIRAVNPPRHINSRIQWPGDIRHLVPNPEQPDNG